MKTYFFALVLIGLFSVTASAQDDAKRRNDVTYSTHNYKHPNKAAAARKWANEKGGTISATGFDQKLVTNYKQPVPRTEAADGLIVPHTAQENLADRNYKVQRVNTVTPVTPSAEIANTIPHTSLPEKN
ncbi:hypothetical protein ACFQ4C_28450 [Larkinella insperata]|uniref:Uncharacterized protein n=1 Tax=Larkinella insperata TaxID=332158 RepID=A0ABW3QMI0_9BACT|nr:hypothetical protein [Larkinella insperata]